MNDSKNDWFQKHVLSELKRLNENVEKLTDCVHEHREQSLSELATLRVKAKLWGGITGAIPGVLAALAALIWFLLK